MSGIKFHRHLIFSIHNLISKYQSEPKLITGGFSIIHRFFPLLYQYLNKYYVQYLATGYYEEVAAQIETSLLGMY